MAAEKSVANLFKSSGKASENQVQHIVFTLNAADGKVLAAGSHNMIATFVGSPELFDLVQTAMRNSYTQEPIIHANTHQLNYPLLPCPPTSIKWNGEVYGVLTKMLVTAGYGRHAMKLGEGRPPLGWPEDIDWTKFVGATRSKLGHESITRIVIAMLVAAGYDPNIHIEVPAVEPNVEEFPAVEPNVEEFPAVEPNVEEFPAVEPNVEEFPAVERNVEEVPAVEPNVEEEIVAEDMEVEELFVPVAQQVDGNDNVAKNNKENTMVDEERDAIKRNVGK